MAALAALSLFAFVAAADCLGDPSECLGDPMNLIQTPRRSLTAQDIINKHFHGIPQGGSFVRKNLVAMNQHYAKEIAAEKEKKTAAWACSTVDFSSFVGSGADNSAVRAIMDTLHITEYCGLYEGNGTATSDPTCRAFWAGMKAHIELQDLHFTPVFVNMAVVNWYANLPGHFPSWGSSDAVTVSYREGKVTNVTIHQPNAVAPYAFCDIAYTTLRQNFDQAGRGQCVPSAVLAALAAVSPAGAIKTGLEMFWTGKPAHVNEDLEAIDPECTYIYHDMPPGVIPYKVGQPGALKQGALEVACSGNQADCTAAEGSPFTNSGFQGMWSIYMTAVNGLNTRSDCKEKNRNAWVKYPGMDEKRLKSIKDGMSPGWAFPRLIHWAFGQGRPEYEEMPTDPVEASKALDLICDSENGAIVFMATGLGHAVTNDPRQGIGMSKDRPWTLEGSPITCGKFPEITNAPDHAVYVDECYDDGDVVSMWTWTGRIYVHRHAVLFWGILPNGRPCPSGAEEPRAQNFYGGVLVPTVSGNLSLLNP